jgi:DNA-binding NarL/FixJ family response regulator
LVKKHRIILADDHAIIRSGLVLVFEQDQEFQVVGEAADGFALLNLLNHGAIPDVLLLDLSMPSLAGIDVLRQIRRMHYSFKILILTSQKGWGVLCETLISGADGFMLKDDMATELLPAIRVLLEDKIYFSPIMAEDLPDTCKLKTAVGRWPLSLSREHCGKGFWGSSQ